MLEHQIIAESSELAAVREQWDELAVTAHNPLNAPAVFFAWYEHALQPKARLRVVVVRDGARLIGLAAFVVFRRRGLITYEPPTVSTVFVPVLVEPGRESEVAAETWSALMQATPRPDRVTVRTAVGASTWQTAPQTRTRMPQPSAPPIVDEHPVIDLTDGFDAWLAGRSRRFRDTVRRSTERFREAGGAFRPSTHDTIEADLATLFELHLAGFEGRASSMREGGTRLQATLLAMARELPPDRMWVALSELDGEPICAQLFFAAGNQLLCWNQGWDRRYQHLQPGLINLLNTVESAAARGNTYIDLGPGLSGYKERFATGVDVSVTSTQWLRHPWLQFAESRARDAVLKGWASIRRRVAAVKTKQPNVVTSPEASTVDT